MRPLTLNAFWDEMDKIAAEFKYLGSAAQQYAKELKELGGASAARLVHGPARAEKARLVKPKPLFGRKRPTQLALPGRPIEKRAASGRLIGAGIGAGLMGAKEALHEWDRIRDSHFSHKKIQPPSRSAMIGRIAGSAALGGLGGGVVGHFGSRAGQMVKRHAQDVGEETSRILSEGFGKAIRQDLVKGMVSSSEQIGQNLTRGAASSFDPAITQSAERVGKIMADSFENAVERAATKMKPLARQAGEDFAAGAKSQLKFPFPSIPNILKRGK